MEKLKLAVTHHLKPLFCSRILVVIFITNMLTMSLCKLFELKTITTVFIYPAIFLITLPAMFSGKNKRTPMKISPNMILWIFTMWMLLTLLRFPYSLEWLPGDQAFAQFDDNQRLAELTSKEKRYLIASLFFFLSTYLTAFAQGNNYSMRGIFILTFIFFLLFAKYVQDLPIVEKLIHHSRDVVLATITIVLFTMGIFLEIGWCAKIYYGSMSMLGNNFNIALPEHVVRNNYRATDRDSSIKHDDRSIDDCCRDKIPEMSRFRCAHFNAEKFMDVSVGNLDFWEKEFLRLPKANRLW